MEFTLSCILNKVVVFYYKDEFIAFRQTKYLPDMQHHVTRRNHLGNQIRTYDMKAKITSWIKRRLCTVFRNQ